MQLQQEINDLKVALEKHEIREGFYSELTSAHVNWIIALIAFITAAVGILFGYISWKKVHSAREDLEQSMDRRLNAHITHVNQDRMQIRHLVSRLSDQQSRAAEEEGKYNLAIYYAIDSLVIHGAGQSFYNSVDENTQSILTSDRRLKISKSHIVGCLKRINRILDLMEQEEHDLRPHFLKDRYDSFWQLEFTFRDLAIEELRNTILNKMAPYFENQPSESKA